MTLVEFVAFLAGMVFLVYVSRFANNGGGPGKPGRLQYGLPIWVLGAAGIVLALAPIVTWCVGHRDEPLATLLASLMGAVIAIYSLGEGAFVRGTFDEHGIAFFTPWSGAKHEAWKDLVSLRYNGACSWYVLKFASGKTVRLSFYLDGHRAAVEAADRNRIPALRLVRCR